MGDLRWGVRKFGISGSDLLCGVSVVSLKGHIACSGLAPKA